VVVADKSVSHHPMILFRRNPRFEGRGPYLDLESYQKFIETGDEPESLRSLQNPDRVNKVKRVNGDRAPGTFEWIMKTDELKRWLDQEQSQINEPASRILWLYGRPGIGKSTLAITIIEAIQKLQSFKNGTKCLAYFFCTSNNQKQKTAVAILEALIYQFITDKRQLIGFLPPDLKKIKENLQDFDTMWDVLMKIGNDSSTGEKYCIVDGLDECEESTDLLRQIGITFKSNSDRDSEPKINILILSRLYPETTRLHLASKDLSLYKEMAQDIDIFVREIMEELKEREWPRYVLEETSRILREKAGGTFLWIGIVSRELMNKSPINALDTLNDLSKDLNSLFRELLDDARKERKEIHLKTLEEIIILCLISHRPLSLLELAEACEILPGKDDEDRSKRVEEDVKICHLMRLTQTRTVELLHQSVREFLLVPATNLLAGEKQHPTNETRLPISELDAHALMADRCIAYLLRTFHGGAILKGSQQETNQFLSYAGAHWMHHASLAADRFLITDKIEAFFRIVSKEREAWLDWYRFHRRSERIPKRFSIFHVAARWGIGPLAEFALSQRSKSEQTQLSNSGTSRRYPYNDSDFMAEKGVTPLEEAAKAGKKEIMVILLQNTPTAMNVKPAVVEAAAANRKHGKELIECLFDDRQRHQVQITGNVRDAAVRNIRKVKEILKLLPRQSEDKTEIAEDVLKAAARNTGKGKEVMELLLDRLGDKADITEDVLKAAARNEGKGNDIIELLLDRLGAKADITEDVLKAAARNEGKGKEIMELLLDLLGDKANITEDVVKMAAGNWKNTEVMALLLEKHRDQIKITKHVVRAARKTKNGEEMIGMLMLELERRSQSDGHHGLQIASWNGTIEDIEKQLLADQASASCANRWGWTPLHAASWHGNIEVVKLLLPEYTVDPSSMNHDEWTALDAAFAKNHMAIAQLLLKHDPSAAANFTPTCFSDTGKSNALELGNDKLEVTYRGWGKGESNVYPFELEIMLTGESLFLGMVGQPGAVYANKPISPLYDEFYFEIKVINLGNG
jgi:DNA polymerase III delta prime subunit